MYKFFLPILIFLVGLWIYVGVFENGRIKKEEEAKKILALYENYEHLNDSISKLADYLDFTRITEQGISFYIPSYLSSANDLSQYSTVQYKNESKEFYLILNKEKTGDYYYAINDYVNYNLGLVKDIVNGFIISDSSYQIINNSAGYCFEILGDFNNGERILPLSYKILMVEHEGYFYQLKIWTTRELHPENKEDIDKIVSSVTFMPDINKAKENMY